MVVVGAQIVEGTRILRHDADGNPLPEVALPTDPIWWVQDLTHTANNELLMVSDTPHPDDPTQRIATVTRFAADGTQTSVEVPGVILTGVAAADNGDIVLAFSHHAAVTFGGETLPASGGGNAIGIARLSASGDLRWMRGLGFGDVSSMGRAGDGFVVNMLSGENWDEPLGGIPGLAPRQTSQVVMKLGGDGAARWWRAPGVLGAPAIVVAPNGGFAWVEGVPNQPFDQIVRFDDNGQPAAWSLPVPTGTLIAVDGQGAVLLGTSVPDGGDLGFGTIERGGVAFLKVGP